MNPLAYWRGALASATVAVGIASQAYMQAGSCAVSHMHGWQLWLLPGLPGGLVFFGAAVLGRRLALWETRGQLHVAKMAVADALEGEKNWRDTAAWYAELIKQRQYLPSCTLCPAPARNTYEDKPRCDLHMPGVGYWSRIAAGMRDNPYP